MFTNGLVRLGLLFDDGDYDSIFGHASDAGNWKPLDDMVLEAGGTAYHVLFSIGVIVSLISLTASAIILFLNSSKPVAMSQAKKNIVKVLFCVAILGGFLIILSQFQKLGLD